MDYQYVEEIDFPEVLVIKVVDDIAVGMVLNDKSLAKHPNEKSFGILNHLSLHHHFLFHFRPYFVFLHCSNLVLDPFRSY